MVERRPLENPESSDLNFPGNTCILEKPRISEQGFLFAEYVACMQDEQLVPARSVPVPSEASVNSWRKEWLCICNWEGISECSPTVV